MTRRDIVKKIDAGKTRMIGLPYGEKNCDDMLSRLHMVPERNGRTDGRTDRHADRFAISISHVSILTRDKNVSHGAIDPSGIPSKANYVALLWLVFTARRVCIARTMPSHDVCPFITRRYSV